MPETYSSEKEIKKRKNTRVYLIVCSIVFGILILPSLPMIMMSAMMFDSPGSEDSISTIILVASLVLYPFVTVIGIAIAWILFVRKTHLFAIISASLPLLNILVGVAAMVYLMIFCDGNFAC